MTTLFVHLLLWPNLSYAQNRTKENSPYPSSHITIKTTITHLVAQVINLSTNSSNLYPIVYLLNTDQIYFSPLSHHYCFYFNLSLILYVDFYSSVFVFFLSFSFCIKHVKQATPVSNFGEESHFVEGSKERNNIHHQKQQPRTSPHSMVCRLPRKTWTTLYVH